MGLQQQQWRLLTNNVGPVLTPCSPGTHISAQAALCGKGSVERLLWLSAFAISGYSGTVNRTSKPFNPLLGETYELLCQEKVLYSETQWGGEHTHRFCLLLCRLDLLFPFIYTLQFHCFH